MVKVNHFLPVPQLRELRALAKTTGLPMAELIRRALDAYLKQHRPGHPTPSTK